jgi:hypothetical protein
MKYPMITAAVVAALGGLSQSAHALDVAQTTAAPVQLVGAGASAARDSFLALLHNSVCTSGTLTVYRALPTQLQDFRAYSCTVTAGGTVGGAFGAAAGGNATIYYRSEGGSAWGPVSIATNRQIQSLVVDSRCAAAGTIAAGSSTVPLFNCAVSSYVASNDTVGAGLVKRTTELGVSDEEPDMYVDTNYPGISSTAFPTFSSTVRSQLIGLNQTVGYAQVFGVLLSDTGPTATITSLSLADVSGIYSGTITDWNDTINSATGAANPDGPIVVVRRENGSGTQVAAAQQFVNTLNCAPSAALPFVTDGPDADSAACSAADPDGGNNTDGVLERGTTSDLEACIRFNAGAVGPNVFKGAPPTGTHYASLNGVFPSKFAAARGDYRYWYELTMQTGTGMSALDSAAAGGLISLSQRVSSIPNSDSVMALPNSFNVPVLPVAAAGVPIAISTKNGNSCQLPIQQSVQ